MHFILLKLQSNIRTAGMAENLIEWMTSLPHQTKNIPIINLAIPGKTDKIKQSNSSKNQFQGFHIKQEAMIRCHTV